MAGELEVTFRGMFTLVLPPSHDHARILMPRNDLPRIARGNERYTIPPYETYVAIPMSARPEPEPDMVCKLPIGHPQVFDPDAAKRELKSPIEKVSRAWRRDRRVPEPQKMPFGIYLATGYQIVLNDLQKPDGKLTYDHTPVEGKKPKPGERSVMWLSQLRKIGPEGDEIPITPGKLATQGTPPAAAATFIDLNSGSMRPAGLVPVHKWRYLQATQGLGRPIAQEIVVATQVPTDRASITLRPFNGDVDRTISFDVAMAALVVVGCEPLDDILGTASVQSCAEPAYDYELHYLLFGDEFPPSSVRPVPVCFEPSSDHRSPPGAACGPPAVTTGSG